MDTKENKKNGSISVEPESLHNSMSELNFVHMQDQSLALSSEEDSSEDSSNEYAEQIQFFNIPFKFDEENDGHITVKGKDMRKDRATKKKKKHA